MKAVDELVTTVRAMESRINIEYMVNQQLQLELQQLKQENAMLKEQLAGMIVEAA